jgi:hypothetical protein
MDGKAREWYNLLLFVCKPWYTKQSQLTTCIKATIKSYSLGDD